MSYRPGRLVVQRDPTGERGARGVGAPASCREVVRVARRLDGTRVRLLGEPLGVAA